MRATDAPRTDKDSVTAPQAAALHMDGRRRGGAGGLRGGAAGRRRRRASRCGRHCAAAGLCLGCMCMAPCRGSAPWVCLVSDKRLSPERANQPLWQPALRLTRLLAAGAPRSPAPADTVLDLSMRLTAGFVQRLLHPPGPLPAAWAAWAALAAARRASMCAAPPACRLLVRSLSLRARPALGGPMLARLGRARLFLGGVLRAAPIYCMRSSSM